MIFYLENLKQWSVGVTSSINRILKIPGLKFSVVSFSVPVVDVEPRLYLGYFETIAIIFFFQNRQCLNKLTDMASPWGFFAFREIYICSENVLNKVFLLKKFISKLLF